MRKAFVAFVAVCVLVMGCSSINDMAKPQICVQNEDGTYTGAPKPAAVAVLSTALLAAAGKLGYSLDSASATTIATVALSKYCDGTIESSIGSVYELLSGYFGGDKEKALRMVVEVYKK